MKRGDRFRAGALLLLLVGGALAQQQPPKAGPLSEEGTTPQEISVLLSKRLRQCLEKDICGFPVTWVVGIDISGSGQSGFQDVVQVVLADLSRCLVVPQDGVRIVPFDREPDPKLDSELIPGGAQLARVLPHPGATALDRQELATLLPRFLETRHNAKGQPVWGSDINKALMFTQREAVAASAEQPDRRAVVLLLSDRQNNDATDTPYVPVAGLHAPGGGGSLTFTTIPLMLRDVAKPSQFWVFI
ncbi:MAG: VWA domain-containing protein, partial [Armatimonadetes bacterium]|nr:VWA domain-containing protein [Armatimonadota bacterium]